MRANEIATFTQRQWYTRPDDQKFSSLEDLYVMLADRKARTHQVDTMMSHVKFIPAGDDIIMVNKDGVHVAPTHWSFGQTCSMVGAHASYLRELPADIAVQCLNWGLKQRVEEKNRGLGLMVVDPRADNATGMPVLQAVTSQVYGRIWDAELAQASLEIVGQTNNRFYSPLDWGKEKRALFASDRDIHLLFIDGGSMVDGGGERDQLHRGFIIGNSEVGARAWYLATFVFRVVCGNFAIHGIEQAAFMKIRHTPGAPMKFVKEALPVITAYVNSSPKPLEHIVKKAKELMLPKPITEHINYFRHRGFAAHETQAARIRADREEGGHETLWQMINGFTAVARDIKHADSKILLEQKAGKLLEQLAA
jgi:hypothetical protein